MKSKTMLYRNLLFLSPIIFIFTLGIIFKIIFGIRSMYNNVPYQHYCENNLGKLLQIMETADGSGSGVPVKKNVTAAATAAAAAAAAAAASSGSTPNLPADNAARIIAENAAAARADLLKRTPPATGGSVQMDPVYPPATERCKLIRINRELKNQPTVLGNTEAESSLYSLDDFHSLRMGGFTEPVFVDLLRRPGIDSQHGGPVRNPICRK